ncbi:zinc-binding dehydrogenase [Pseudomonas chlororaphis]
MVTAASSGVAQSLIALTRARNINVIGLVFHGAKAEAISKRFDNVTVIGTDQDEWQSAVRQAAGQAPLVAIDPIGGEMMPKLLALLAPRGTLITYGALDLKPAAISLGFLTSFELSIRGCSAIGWATTTSVEQRAADFNTLLDLARQSLHLFSGYNEYPIDSVIDAIAAAEPSPRRGGTILVS